MKSFGLKLKELFLAVGLLVGAASVCSGGQNVTLAWDSNAEPGLTGYKIHFGVKSQVYTNCITVGTNATAVVTNLVEGVTYYFVATAFSTTGLESLPSNEVSYSVPVLNHAPVANDDHIFADIGIVSRFSLLTLLRNDLEPDHDAITISAVNAKSAMNATVTLSGNYVFYSPPTSFQGEDSFVYTLADGKGGSAQATVKVTVAAPVKPVRNPSSIKSLADGCKNVTFQGFPGSRFMVEASTNLVNWATIATVVADSVGGIEYVDAQAAMYSSRYYRLTVP
jgi:hypothetical protein